MDGLHLLLHFWRFKMVLLACAVLGLAAGIVRAHLAEPLYAVAMTVGPSPTENQPSLGSSLSSGIAAQLLGTTQASPAYVAFIQMLTSADAAEAVARNGDAMQAIFKRWWDPETKKWRTEQHGLGASLKALLGLPPARPPTAYDLGAYLQRHVQITPVGKTSIDRIEFRTEDPAFGVSLLQGLTLAADQLAKDEERTRLDAYLKKIDDLLATVQAADIRTALTELYSRSEEQRLLILDNQLYSATIIDSPRASSSPVWPTPLTIAEYAALGLALGACITLGLVSFVLLSSGLARGDSSPHPDIAGDAQAIIHAHGMRS